MKALIVDDSAVMRKVVERALRQAGLGLTQVVEAVNGEAALEALRSEAARGEDLSIILSDIHMPVMDGLSFVEALHSEKLAPNVPVVMITTEGTEQQVLRAIAAGARGYLCKPFTAEQVRAKVLPLVRSQ